MSSGKSQSGFATSSISDRIAFAFTLIVNRTAQVPPEKAGRCRADEKSVL
jgi:hypothetical protein